MTENLSTISENDPELQELVGTWRAELQARIHRATNGMPDATHAPIAERIRNEFRNEKKRAVRSARTFTTFAGVDGAARMNVAFQILEREL